MTEGREIGRRIRAARQGRYTQAELAEQLGVSKSLVSRWEAGSRQPPLTKLGQLSRLLGKPLSYFIPDSYEGAATVTRTDQLPVYRLCNRTFSKDDSIGCLGDVLMLDDCSLVVQVQDEALAEWGYFRGDLLLLQKAEVVDDRDLVAIRDRRGHYQLVLCKDVSEKYTKSTSQALACLKVTGFFRPVR